MAANNKKMQFLYASNTWDHRLSTSARLKFNITFPFSENSEHILYCHKGVQFTKVLGEDEEAKVFGAGTKMQSYTMKLRLLPLTPLQRESLHGNAKGTKIAAIHR